MLLQVGIFLVFLSVGYFFGRYNEKRHYASIIAREKDLMHMITTASKHPVGDSQHQYTAMLVSGSAVVSIDYFKRIVAGLRQVLGGNVSAYETLVDRARREAVLRLKESCPQAVQIINLRIETASIFKGQGNQVGSVEVLAYGTALI